jgi:hypothetical protein
MKTKNGLNVIIIMNAFLKLNTVRPRFWQLVGAAKTRCQNRVLPKSDNERKNFLELKN